MSPRSPVLAGVRWSPSAALQGRRVIRPLVVAAILLHLLLVLLGQRAGRSGRGGQGPDPGNGAALGLGGAPAVERAEPGASGLPADLRLGWVELGRDSQPVAPPPAAKPAAPAAKAAPPVAKPAPAAPSPSPAATPAPAESPAAAPPAPDPAGSLTGGPSGSGGDGPGGGAGGSGAGGSGPGDGANSDFVRGRDLLPVVQSMTVPDYPKAAKGKSRVPVVLLVHVTAAGLVDDVKRAESTDCPPCEQAAIESAWKLRFTPGIKNGEPAAMWVRYPVTFGRK